MLGFSVSKQELRVFLEELNEQLQELELLILKIEKSDSPGEIQELFRITHTIKGSAASVGHQTMASLAHGMESILDKVRQGKLEVSPRVSDVLLRSLDGLKALKKDLDAGRPLSYDAGVLVSALESFSHEETASSDKTYEIVSTFAPDCEMPAVRAYQILMSLQKMGGIADSNPSLEDLKTEGTVFSRLVVRLSSPKSSSEIERSIDDVSEISGVAVRALEAEDRSRLGPVLDNEMKHELKGIHTVRVNVDLFDNLMNLVGELVIGKTRLLKIGSYVKNWEDAGSLGQELVDSIQHLSQMIGELQEEVMKARLVPMDVVLSKFPRILHDLSRRSGKEIDFKMEGQETQLDRSVLDEIGDPLIHLLRNAADHGIETPELRTQKGKNRAGKIILQAYQEENHVVILVRDDGAGLDVEAIRRGLIEKGLVKPDKARLLSRQEIIAFIFTPGFSTAKAVSDVSGRGVGLDIVKQRLEKIGGSISVETELGQGTAFKIRIPFSVAIVRGLQVSVGDTMFAVPLASVQEIVQMRTETMRTIGGHRVLVSHGEVIPLIWLGECFEESFPSKKEIYPVVILTVEQKQVGLMVDGFLGNQEFVIKTMGEYVGDLPGISGATVLADGTVGLILDVPSFIRSIQNKRNNPEPVPAAV